MTTEALEPNAEKGPLELVQEFVDSHSRFLYSLEQARRRPASFEILGRVSYEGDMALAGLQPVLDAGFFRDSERDDMEIALNSFSSATQQLPTIIREVNQDYVKNLVFEEGFLEEAIGQLLDPETTEAAVTSLKEIYSGFIDDARIALPSSDKFADFFVAEHKKARLKEKTISLLGVAAAAYIGSRLAQRRKK